MTFAEISWQSAVRVNSDAAWNYRGLREIFWLKTTSNGQQVEISTKNAKTANNLQNMHLAQLVLTFVR